MIAHFQSLSWTDCGLIVCALGSIACLFRPRAFLRRSGAIIMGTALIAIAAFCIAVSGIVAAISLFAVRRDRIGYQIDTRTKQQIMDGAAIEQGFTDIRTEQMWRERVRANERARLNRKWETPSYLRKQAG